MPNPAFPLHQAWDLLRSNDPFVIITQGCEFRRRKHNTRAVPTCAHWDARAPGPILRRADEAARVDRGRRAPPDGAARNNDVDS